jgi:hypothetical protein
MQWRNERTNNDGKITTQKMKDQAIAAPIKTEWDLRCSGVNNRCVITRLNYFRKGFFLIIERHFKHYLNYLF